MKGALILVSLAGLALAVEGGYWGAIGWGLFLASLVAIYVQYSIITKLKGELAKEQGLRMKLDQQVKEQTARIDKQQQEILRFSELELEFERQLEQIAKEKAELVKRIEELEKERIVNRKHLVELAKSNEFMRTTLDNLVARIQTLEGRA